MIQFRSKLLTELITICDELSVLDIAICDLKELNSSHVTWRKWLKISNEAAVEFQSSTPRVK